MVIKGMLVPCQIATRDVITLFLHRLHFANNQIYRQDPISHDCQLFDYVFFIRP